MKKKTLKERLHKSLLKEIREDFIEDGGLDGRFKEKVVEDKKKYKRTKAKKELLTDLRFLYWE